MSRLKKMDKKSLQLAGISVVLLIAVISLRGELFLRPINLTFMMFQLVEPGLFALCIALAYLSRGIDLSIVSTANLVAILNGMMLRYHISPDGSNVGLLLFFCVVIALAVGLTCGVINGTLISKLGISPILVTLGTQSAFMGISMGLTRGRAEGNFPQALIDFGNMRFGAVPLLTILFIIVFIIVCVIVHKTPYGLKLQWLGSNKKAAWFTGIDNARVTMITYTLSGLLAALAGLVIMARTNSARADYGLEYVFQALLICVLAGISPLGGRGKVYNVLLSLVALQILSTGFNLMRISPMIRDSIFGFLLVFSLLLDFALEKYRNNKLNKQALTKAASSSPPTPPPNDSA